MDKVRLLIADDSRLTVLGLSTAFKKSEDIEIVGTAENGMVALEMCKAIKPDVILMDIGMPVLDGIQATRELKKLDIHTKVVMLTSHDSHQDVFDALCAGANSYCMKDISSDTLASVIKSTHNGASWLDPAIAKIVLSSFTGQSGSSSGDIVLTERETEILKLIALGLSNQEISERLFISMNTVKTHIKNIFQKLEVEDRTQAAMKAFGKNYISPPLEKKNHY